MKALHLFCGLGGGALGFQRAGFETLLGVDLDAAACADFETLTRAPSLVADMATLTPGELLDACGGEAPDVVFTSPPCKGFSGLLPSKRLAEPHYQALNRLVFQGLWLALETFRPRPPKLIVLENVPRITQRGADLLRQVQALLEGYGYRIHTGFHDCGELGGLAQHRRRFLLVARHEAQVPTFVYQPAKRRVRSIGEVLGALPMPDDPAGGPMHRLPRLQWKTWERLALIPAGGDWRALGTKGDATPFNNQFRIVPWGAPSVAVTGGGTPTSGGVCCADPRFPQGYRRDTYGVRPWDEASGAVTGEAAPSTGKFSVADPRFAAGGAYSESTYSNLYRVVRFDEPAPTVTGATRPSGGAFSVSDPRIGGKGSRPDLFGVYRWDQPAKTITGQVAVSSSNSPGAVADPRIPEPNDRPDPPPVIVALDGTWHRPLTTLELGALQGFPMLGPDGPLVLAGTAHTAWRERIGNAVPPPAAQAIAEQLLRCLEAAAQGRTFELGGTPVWVDRRAFL